MTNLNPRSPNSSLRMAEHHQLPTKLARAIETLRACQLLLITKKMRDLAKMGREIRYFPFLADEK